jgi:hypothetical protein
MLIEAEWLPRILSPHLLLFYFITVPVLLKKKLEFRNTDKHGARSRSNLALLTELKALICQTVEKRNPEPE